MNGYHFCESLLVRQLKMKWQTYEEKMTDVNIAVELLGDAQDDVFDTAIIVLGMVIWLAPVRAVQEAIFETNGRLSLFPLDGISAG